MTEAEPQSRKTVYSPLAVMVAALAIYFSISYAAAYILYLLVDFAGETFVFTPAAIVNAAMPFLIFSLALTLAWLILIRLPGRRAPAAITFAAGVLFVLLYLPILSFPAWLRDSPVGQLRLVLWNVGTPSFYYSAVACVIIGVVGLLRRSNHTSDPEHPT